MTELQPSAVTCAHAYFTVMSLSFMYKKYKKFICIVSKSSVFPFYTEMFLESFTLETVFKNVFSEWKLRFCRYRGGKMCLQFLFDTFLW